MHSLHLTLLLAATTSAQLTTSFWALGFNFGTDKIGFYGSVINANSSHATLAVVYDNGTDLSALRLANNPLTYIVGPTLWETSADYHIVGPATQSGANIYKLHCEQANTADTTANATCTATYGPGFERLIQCNTGGGRSVRSTSYLIQTYTYSDRGSYSAGVETITRTYILGPNTMSVPDWCSNQSFVPQSNYVTTYPVSREAFDTYQVVITAGVEKLNTTQRASVSVSSARPTSAQGSRSESATPQATGNTAPVLRAGPVVMGVGVMVAALLV